MPTITVEIGSKQIKEIITQLTPKEIVDLIREYQRKKWIKKLDILTEELSKHAKVKRITNKEIDQICEEVRRKHHEEAYRSN